MQANSTLENAKTLMIESRKRHYVFRLPALERMSHAERLDRKAAAAYILAQGWAYQTSEYDCKLTEDGQMQVEKWLVE